MTSIGGFGGPHFDHIIAEPIQQALLNGKNGTSGSVDGTAATDGTATPVASPVFAPSDQSGTDSTNDQTSSQTLPVPLLSNELSAELIASQAQSQQTVVAGSGSAPIAAPVTPPPVTPAPVIPAPIGGGPSTNVAQQLFSQIDSNGDGSITKADLETAVTKDGGTTKQADALYAKLDPNNTGSVDEQQFQKSLNHLTRHGGRHHGEGGAQSALQDLLDPSSQDTSGTEAAATG